MSSLIGHALTADRTASSSASERKAAASNQPAPLADPDDPPEVRGTVELSGAGVAAGVGCAPLPLNQPQNPPEDFFVAIAVRHFVIPMRPLSIEGRRLSSNLAERDSQGQRYPLARVSPREAAVRDGAQPLSPKRSASLREDDRHTIESAERLASELTALFLSSKRKRRRIRIHTDTLLYFCHLHLTIMCQSAEKIAGGLFFDQSKLTQRDHHRVEHLAQVIVRGNTCTHSERIKRLLK